jgi:hypothetical protein
LANDNDKGAEKKKEPPERWEQSFKSSLRSLKRKKEKDEGNTSGSCRLLLLRPNPPKSANRCRGAQLSSLALTSN